MVAALIQSLQSEPRKHSFEFVAFAAEEEGLLGAKSYMDAIPKADRPAIRAMVNFDCLGLGPAVVWGSRANAELLKAAGAVAASLKMILKIVDVDQVGESDSRPFRDQKLPVIDFHSATQETLSILHSPADNLSALKIDGFVESYRLLSMYAAYLDQTLQ